MILFIDLKCTPCMIVSKGYIRKIQLSGCKNSNYNQPSSVLSHDGNSIIPGLIISDRQGMEGQRVNSNKIWRVIKRDIST